MNKVFTFFRIQINSLLKTNISVQFIFQLFGGISSMVLTTYSDLTKSDKLSKEQEQVAMNIQRILDSQKRKSKQQFFDMTGRRLCALLLPKDKNV